MIPLSTTFLQYSLTPSPTTYPPAKSLRFRISSVKVDEKPTSSPTIITTFLNPKKLTAFDHQTERRGTRRRKTKKKKSIVSIIFNSLDNFICKYIDPPLRSSIDPKHVLSGNFAPVDELPPTVCEVVEGTIPPCLDGAYIRNGPNPQFIPQGPYHLFDGDGMLHSIRITNGVATFCSRFIRTYKYTVEREIGSPVMLNVFSAFNGLAASIARCAVTFGRIVAGEYDPRRGIGTANTSLALFGTGELFALGESDLPYRIKITSTGDIITLGRRESFGAPFMTMTAHPKMDPETGEAFAFRQSITFRPPFLIYFKINEKGEKQQEVPIFSQTEASLNHDFAVSKKYAVFSDTQIVMDPKNILKGMPVMGVDPKKVPRLGILPRAAEDESEIWWVEVPGCNMVHAVNAWDEDGDGGGDKVVMVATNVSPVELALDRMDLVHSSLERIEINVREKIVKRRRLSSASLEFGVINPAFAGKKNRYIYAAIGSPMPKISGVVKIDTSLSTVDSDDCTVASRIYGPKCYGGEAIFISRQHDNPAIEEDDGYLVTYVHNEVTSESKFIVMDAKSTTLEIVAEVKLPQRVPYGFHGIFVPEFHLKNCNLKNPN